MVLDECFSDVNDRNKVIGIIVSAIVTALLVHLFEVGIIMSIVLFFAIMLIVWMGLSIDEKDIKGD